MSAYFQGWDVYFLGWDFVQVTFGGHFVKKKKKHEEAPDEYLAQNQRRRADVERAIGRLETAFEAPAVIPQLVVTAAQPIEEEDDMLAILLCA
jgi:hypothetical protein